MELKKGPDTHKRNLLKIRSKALPQPPKNTDEIGKAFENGSQIFARYGMTKRDDEEKKTKFFQTAFHCNDFEYSIFCSENIVAKITENIDINMRDYYIDGTFKVCPRGNFYQLLIISMDYMGQVELIVTFVVYISFIMAFFISRHYK